MFTPLNERVSVVVVYANNAVKPYKLRWRGQEHLIEKITLTSDLTEGIIKRRVYSVQFAGALYRLEFNRMTEHWKLLEVYCE